MKIPEYWLKYEMYANPNSPTYKEDIAGLEKFIRERRQQVASEPRFDTLEEAREAALKRHIEAESRDDDAGTLLSVWKEPEDVGVQYAVIQHENLEFAAEAGYTEVVSVQDIFKLAKRPLAPEEGPNGIDRWTSNGYGLILNGEPVEPISEVLAREAEAAHQEAQNAPQQAEGVEP